MTRSMEMSGSGTVMRGQSRIPNGGAGMKQSRLELLQADYQKKLLREKEEKMLQLYEQNQQRALNRVNNRQGSGGGLSRGGSVREFFNERRALQGKGGAPPIQQHYTQYQKSPSGSAKTQHSTTSYSSATSHKTGTSYSSGYGNSRSAPEAYRNSAGRDRAKPLAPIGPRAGPVSPPNNHSSGRAPVPPIQQKPRLYQRKPSVGKSDTDRNGNRAYRGQMNQRQNVDNTGYDSDGSPPPNHSTGKQQQRRAQVQRGGNHMSSGQSSPQKLTDFQKWQLEQNQAREERLKRKKQQYHSSSGASDASDRDEQDSGVDVNEEIRRRQEELEARLQVEQAELQRIQTQRQQKEEKERQKKARQERAERERQKRLEEQRERQRQAEEERQRLQEERRQAEERRQEEEEERRRASRASRQSRTNRQTDDEYSTTPRYGHQTHQKSPVKTHRSQRPDYRQERRRQRSPSPVINDEELFVPGPSVDIYAQAAHDADAYGQKVEMAPCRICGRRFAKDRLAKHQNACKSVAKPRKVFDPVKMRTEGTEAAKYVNTKQSKRQPPPSTKKSNWRAQHESFIQSIRYAKKMTEYEAAGVKLSDLPPPPPSDTSDYVQCPHCNRRFNAGVAERHIPKCVNIKAKPRPPPNRRR